MLFFFFKQKTAYEMRISDWSSDVCSSDLAAEVVDVAVGIDHGLHRLAASVRVVEVNADLRGFGRDQRIDHGDAFLALDDSHVGEIEIALLVDAIGDPEQAADVCGGRVAPQAGIYRGWRLDVRGDAPVPFWISD